MRINIIPAIIAIALSILLAYGVFSLNIGINKYLITSGSFLFFAITLMMAFAFSSEHKRTTTNLRALSVTFFTIGLLGNVLFAKVIFSVPAFIVTNGILLLVFILLSYTIFKLKQ